MVALESAEEQLRRCAGGSRAEVDELVASTLDELDSGRAQTLLAHIAQVWASADHAALARYAEWCECQRTTAEAAAMRRLLDDRNPAHGRAHRRRCTPAASGCSPRSAACT